ncbi:MAG: choice-of-anchor Q domain-containing protein [Pseudomonadota bacterium]
MAEFLVTTLDDAVDATDGLLSLREAISTANQNGAADRISFDSSLTGGTLTLSQGSLIVTETVEIDGDSDADGRRDITLSGGDATRLMIVEGGATTLARLNIVDGIGFDPAYLGGSLTATYGGAAVIAASGTQLNLVDSLVSGHSATLYGYGGAIRADGAIVNITGSILQDNEGDFGGAVAVREGTLTVFNSTLAGNQASTHGGALFATDTNVYVANTTLAGNLSNFYGGGLYASGGQQRVVNTTITDNDAAYFSGGLDVDFADLTLVNSIVAGNRDFLSNGAEGPEIRGLITLEGTNIVGGAVFQGETEIASTTVEEIFAEVANGGGVLADNGGDVPTVRLNIDGPAVDAADPSLLPIDLIDQDGDGDLREILSFDSAGNLRLRGTGPDLGAAELSDGTALTVTTLQDEAFEGGDLVAETLDGGGLSLREAIGIANGAADAQSITFDASLSGGRLILTGGELLSTGDLTLLGDLDGNGTADIRINGAANSRILNAEGDLTTVDGVVFENGQDYAGGAILTPGRDSTLIVTNSRFVNNRADGLLEDGTTGNGGFGGAIKADGDLTIQSTVFSRNDALTGDSVPTDDRFGEYGLGGAVFSWGSTLINDTRFEDGRATVGGALYHSGTNIEITSSAFVSNAAYSAGAISLNSNSVKVSGTLIEGNSASLFGGGINGRGKDSFIIDGSTFSRNIAGDGGAIFGSGSLEISSSTFSQNSADYVGAVRFFGPGTVSSIENSTFSSNTANEAAILGIVSDVSIKSSTFTGNSVSEGSSTFLISDTANVILRNSIILDEGEVPNVSDLTQSGTNIIGTDIFENGVDVGDTSAEQVFAEVLDGAGVLADNGGLVQTVAILEGGDAEDRGDASLLPADTFDLDGDGDLLEPLPLDAAGNIRVAGKFLDLGAFEFVRPTPGGTEGSDLITGLIQDETLIGLGGDDTLLGDGGDDLLIGGEGADSLNGGTGTDTVSFADANARVIADIANQVAGAGEAEGDRFALVENIIGSTADDQLHGNGLANLIDGGAEADRLFGRAGDDTLLGEAGDDTLAGNAGQDRLIGAEGDDTYLYFRLTDSEIGFIRRDIIEDFEQGSDRIDLSRLDADEGLAGDQRFDFVLRTAFSGTAGELRYFKATNLGVTVVQVDTDGDAVQDMQIELSGFIDLEAQDFLL